MIPALGTPYSRSLVKGDKWMEFFKKTGSTASAVGLTAEALKPSAQKVCENEPTFAQACGLDDDDY